jgi:protein-S-isoprenylcysteine O-methyltransferase Ste14
LSPYLTLVFAWSLFGVIHSVFATSAAKTLAAKLAKNAARYYRISYSLVAVATLAWVLHVHFSIEETILWLPPWFEKLLAGIAAITGLVIMFICIKKYFMYLSGVDAFLDKKPTAGLEQAGLHAHVRHPLYAGTLLFVWAIFFGYPYLSNFISCMCITVYTLVGIYFEEKKLVKEYGDAYRTYKAEVPALIPRLRARG